MRLHCLKAENLIIVKPLRISVARSVQFDIHIA
jgi:hypothetical protein